MNEIVITPNIDVSSKKRIMIKLGLLMGYLLIQSIFGFILYLITNNSFFSGFTAITFIIIIMPGILLLVVAITPKKLKGSIFERVGCYIIGNNGITVNHPWGTFYQIPFEKIECIEKLDSRYNRSIRKVIFSDFSFIQHPLILSNPFIIYTEIPILPMYRKILGRSSPIYTKFRLGDNEKCEGYKLIKEKLRFYREGINILR